MNGNMCRINGGTWRWLFLIFLIGSVLTAYKYFRFKLLRNRRSHMCIPLVVNGYSQLKPNDDAPVFV